MRVLVPGGLKKLDKAVLDAYNAGLDESADHLIKVLRKYPPQKSVTRKEAYGQTFFTDRQRRWFFANLKSGELKIPHERSGDLGRGWKKQASARKGQRAIVNTVGYADRVMGPGQSRMSKLIGWRKVANVRRSEAKDINNIVESAMDRARKKIDKDSRQEFARKRL